MKQPLCKLCGGPHYKTFCRSKTNVKQLKKNLTSKPKKLSKPKSKTRGYYVRQLDKVFSLYIRQRDDGKGCITCGDLKPIKEMQNCHFFSRGRFPTRWDETNCHSGCFRCNVLLKGNYIAYTLFMVDKYGRAYVDELELKSKSNTKFATIKIREMIDFYTLQLKK